MMRAPNENKSNTTFSFVLIGAFEHLEILAAPCVCICVLAGSIAIVLSAIRATSKTRPCARRWVCAHLPFPTLCADRSIQDIIKANTLHPNTGHLQSTRCVELRRLIKVLRGRVLAGGDSLFHQQLRCLRRRLSGRHIGDGRTDLIR